VLIVLLSFGSRVTSSDTIVIGNNVVALAMWLGIRRARKSLLAQAEQATAAVQGQDRLANRELSKAMRRGAGTRQPCPTRSSQGLAI